MNKWTIVTAAVLLLAAAGAGAMYYVAGTPQYSLYQIKRAVADHDRIAFRKHFDVDRVVVSAVEAQVGAIPAGPNVVSEKAQTMLVPASEALIRERLDERFDDPSSAAILNMAVDSVRYQGDAAIVTLKDRGDGSTTALTLARNADRQWRVVAMDLAKANIAYTLQEARQRAEQTMAPELPTVNKPQLPAGLVP